MGGACHGCGRTILGNSDYCVCGEYLRWEVSGAIGPQAPTEARGPTSVEGPIDTGSPVEARVPEPVPASVQPRDPVMLALTRAPGDPSTGPLRVTVAPGGRASLTGIVRNQSRIVDNYQLGIQGLPPAWWTATPDVVFLNPDRAQSPAEAEQGFEIAFHPPREAEAAAGEWTFQVIAMSRATGQVTTVEGRLLIGSFDELEARLHPQRVSGGRSARLALDLRSRGNAVLNCSFDGEDAEGQTRLRFDPPRAAVPGGSEARVAVQVSARRPLCGEVLQRQITVHVRSAAGDRAERAVFLQEPWLTRRRLLPWRIVLTLLSAALLVGASFMHWKGSARGVCLSATESCLGYDRYLQTFDVDVQRPELASGIDGLFAFGTSIGIISILLGVLALLSGRRGRLTRIAGVLAILILFPIAVSLRGDVGVGAWLAVLGGILALLAGVLGGLSSRSRS